MPEGQKSYSKTKPIQFSEFQPIIEWWNNRKESDVAWKVNVNDLKDWDLDIKNPIQEEEERLLTTTEALVELDSSISRSHNYINELKEMLK